MAKSVSIDPVSRIEGHLAIRVEVEANKVVAAFSSGEMFRGFETILKGRDPLDAQQITQRICGVCPISHGLAACLAQDMAYQISPTENGRLARNIILAANYIQSHIIHFYQLSALDFVDISAIASYGGKDLQLRELKRWVKAQLSSNLVYPAAPFLPRYDGNYITDKELNFTAIKHYLEALEMRSQAHQMAAIFGAKLPHATALVPGGITEKVTAKKIIACREILKRLQTFIDHAYLPDLLAVASAFPEYFKTGKGCGNFLAYGVFSESSDPTNTLFPSGVLMDGRFSSFNAAGITEDVRHSYFSSPSRLRPERGQTQPAPRKHGAYSWLKAPRYQGAVMEVGPLARILVAYHQGANREVTQAVDNLLEKIGESSASLISVWGRHAARGIECKIVADRCSEWVEQLIPSQPACRNFTVSEQAHGVGLTEAPRGALGHWINIENHKIENYQCVVPSTWNCSPRDDGGNPGPMEQALVGTPIADSRNPIEASRVVRSFDPCLACAVH